MAKIDPGQLDQLLHPMIDPTQTYEALTQGLNASPGAAVGKVVFDADTAAERGKAGEAVILVRWETSPDDIHGLISAQGVLTSHGGMTSHAAVVARGMGKPAVCGADQIEHLREGKDSSRSTAPPSSEGDILTIDGTTGKVILGAVDLVPPQINENFQAIVGWADEIRTMAVRTNADTPEDADQGARVRRPGHRPLPHRAHVHGRGPAADRPPDDPGRRQGSPRRRPRQAAADAAGRFRGHLRGHARSAGDHPAAGSAAARVPARLHRPDGRAGARQAHRRRRRRDRREGKPGDARPLAQGNEPDAGYPRLPPRHPVARDLRDAGAGHHAGRRGRPEEAGRRAAGGDHDPAGRLRRGAAR